MKKKHFQTHPITHWNYQPLTLPISSFIGESISMFDDKICMKPQNANTIWDTVLKKISGHFILPILHAKNQKSNCETNKDHGWARCLCGQLPNHWQTLTCRDSPPQLPDMENGHIDHQLKHAETPNHTQTFSWYTLLQSNRAIRKCIETSHFLIPCWQ